MHRPEPDGLTLDAGPGYDAGPCDPVANTGCPGGDSAKCTWLRSPSTDGHVGCAPWGGGRPTGEACLVGLDGMGEHDNCAGGSLCVEGICRRFCELAATTCPEANTCQRVAGVFTDLDPPVGVCLAIP